MGAEAGSERGGGAQLDRKWPLALSRVGRGLLRMPRKIAWLAPLAWGALIFALSSFRAPLGELPSSGIMALLGNLAHAFEFGILMLLLVPLLPRDRDWVRWSRLTRGLLPGSAFLFAVSDEYHQSRVPGRDASLLDLCTDLAGILAVYIVVHSLQAEDVSTRRMKKLLVRALVACCLCAGAATAWGAVWKEGPWPFPG